MLLPLPWGEHVVSLLFADIAKIEPVWVCYILLVFSCVVISIVIACGISGGGGNLLITLKPHETHIHRFWFWKHAGSTMYSDQAPTMLFMLNSWPSCLWPIRFTRWDFSEVLVHELLCGSMQWCICYGWSRLLWWLMATICHQTFVDLTLNRGSSPKLPQKKIEIQRDHTSQGWRRKAKRSWRFWILAMIVFPPLAQRFSPFEYRLL